MRGVMVLCWGRCQASRSCAEPERVLCPARHAELLRRLRVHPSLEQARRDTVRFAEEARAMLAPLPEGYAKSALAELCDAVVHRAG